jgi:hypothetical protein
MLKQATLAQPLAARSTEGAQSTIPAGPCWILEGMSWVTVFWNGEAGRQSAGVPIRDYNAYVSRGLISDVAPRNTQPSLLSRSLNPGGRSTTAFQA